MNSGGIMNIATQMIHIITMAISVMYRRRRIHVVVADSRNEGILIPSPGQLSHTSIYPFAQHLPVICEEHTHGVHPPPRMIHVSLLFRYSMELTSHERCGFSSLFTHTNISVPYSIFHVIINL